MGNTLGLCSNVNVVTVIYFIKSLITVISIVVPIILIIMATVDIVTAIMLSEEEMKKKYSICIKRFIYAIVFFLIPTIVNLLFNIINLEAFVGTNDYKSALCFNEATSDNIEILKNQKEQEIEKENKRASAAAKARIEEAKKKTEEINKQLEEIEKKKKEEEANSNSQSSSGNSSSNNDSSKKVMLIAGHSPGGADVGASGEASKTREIALEIEKYLKEYVSVEIFNRDVMGEDLSTSSFNTSALEYFADCSDKNELKYSKSICEEIKGKSLNKTYDFKSYSYVLELHFNSNGGAGTFITSANTCSDSSNSSGCKQNSSNATKLSKITTAIMKYMKNTGIGYNGTSKNGIRDDWYVIERYVRVSTDYQTPSSLMEVCAVDSSSDLSVYNSNKSKIAEAIARGIVEGLGLTWKE